MNFFRRVFFLGFILSCFMMVTAARLMMRPDVAWAASGMGCGISSRYPESIRQWCALIEHHAGENGLDPNLVAAVILQESGGMSGAYSKSGAVGLMQVMPKDGVAAKFNCPNGPCFANRPSMSELFEPQFNIAYGCRMLSGLVYKYGDIREALKAYGPMDMGYAYADLVLRIYRDYR